MFIYSEENFNMNEHSSDILKMCDNFKKLREKNHLTFQELSRQTGIPAKKLSAIEKYDISNFRLSHLGDLCKFYGLEPIDIFINEY